jgi:tRNA-specific 2-thiouridylase
MTREPIAIALSGGLDSAVAALQLIDQNNHVFGVTFRLWQELPGGNAGQSMELYDPTEKAREVARALDIPLHIIDARVPFRRRVVDKFVAEYGAGRTPNPCLYCNRHIKFDFLLQQALSRGAQKLATGHYARIRVAPDDSTRQLLRGVDARKDQSYVLYMLGQDELARVVFPLGEYTKEQVRDIAKQRHLPVAQAEESQDLCFVAGGDYRRFLQRYAPHVFTPGPILDAQGNEIGRHQGLAAYTIGQRSGIGISASEALYVLRLDIDRNALIVGPKRALGRDTLIVQDVLWVGGKPPRTPFHAEVKIRYRARLAPATVTALPGARAQIEFSEPLRDITPGQGAVFYDDIVVLGGGIIAR